jgi:cytosine deaminase
MGSKNAATRGPAASSRLARACGTVPVALSLLSGATAGMLLLKRARVPAAVLTTTRPGAGPAEAASLWDIEIDGQRIVSVSAHRQGREADRSVDLAGRIVLPAFVDAHVHLDKAHTWDRAPNRSGRFAEALETLAADKANWTRADLLRRGGFALRCAWEHGTRLIRTHVDTWLPWGEVNHAAMAELREEWRGRIELQAVPLTGVANYGGAEGEAIADLALKYGACALGGWSPMSPELPRQLERLLAIAADRGVGVDLHVDENGRPEEEVLRTLAEAVIRTRFAGPVVCGHCCSLAVQEPERQRSTIALVREAGIRVVSLPLCNLYLQGRPAGTAAATPRWRGITLIHELIDAGVPVASASDNVRDAFYAFGDLDAAEVLIETVRLAHLDARLGDALRAVTSVAADILGRPDMGRIGAGLPARLVVFPARSLSELLSRPGSGRQLVDGERIQDSSPPAYDELS